MSLPSLNDGKDRSVYWKCQAPSSVDGRASYGTSSSGISGPANSRRHGAAITRAHRADRLTRALSVAIPVLAYICRYSFEMRTNARRAFSVETQLDRSQMLGKL